VSSLPVQPINGSMNGGDCGSNRSFHWPFRAPPDVIADRVGRKITASGLPGNVEGASGTRTATRSCNRASADFTSCSMVIL
jgi:hypothetical protein